MNKVRLFQCSNNNNIKQKENNLNNRPSYLKNKIRCEKREDN